MEMTYKIWKQQTRFKWLTMSFGQIDAFNKMKRIIVQTSLHGQNDQFIIYLLLSINGGIGQ